MSDEDENLLEVAREGLRRVLLDNFRRGTAEHVVDMIDMLIEVKIDQALKKVQR